MQSNQKPIFLSHASKDKALADKLSSLLTNGCDVSPNQIVCTSLPGKGIPGGTPSFIDYLRGQLGEPKLVILLLSENYFVSQFCLCELGATWRMGLPVFPLVVPPLAKSELGGVLEVMQAGSITDERYIDQLREAVIKHLGRSVPTDGWNLQAGVFLDGLNELISGLEKPAMVHRTELEKAHVKSQAAIAEIAKMKRHETELKAHIADLEKLKDKEQVRAITQQYSSEQEQFDSLVDAVQEAIKKLRTATVKAIFFEQRGENYAWDGEAEFREAREAEQLQELDIHYEHTIFCKPSSEHNRVWKAKETLNNLSDFLRDGKHSDFVANLVEYHGFPINLSNKEVWRDILKVYV